VAYVEVKAKTIELAIEAAMRELKVTDRERLDVRVLQEPERGFLGFGGQDAIVRVEERRGGDKRTRRRRGAGKGRQEGRAEGGVSPKPAGGSPAAGDRRAQGGGGPDGPTGDGGTREGGSRSGGRGRANSDRRDQRPKAPQGKQDDRDPLSTETQEPLVKGFLSGLVDAFGLEGRVETRLDDDVIVANVVGDQTEALVGPRGSVMEAVHELTKTVLQRTAQDSARVRIDIAGYAERRRQALTIYAGDLIDQVVRDGGEIMLDPMSAADRKVIHDAVGARDGVRSYSEGEAPERYVVIAATDPAVDEEE
jgi:spoIIIJ-associated protein